MGGLTHDSEYPLLDLTREHALITREVQEGWSAVLGGMRLLAGENVGQFEKEIAAYVKNLGAYGDGGFVTTSSTPLADHIKILRSHGQESKNHHVRYGHNSRLDELQAVVLRVTLRCLDGRNRRRRAIAAFYNSRLRPFCIHVPEPEENEEPVYHQYVIRTPERDRLQAYLRERGIETGIHYPIPLHFQPAWRRVYGARLAFPHAERLAGEILSLPVFPDLSDDEIEYVASSVASFFAGARRARAMGERRFTPGEPRRQPVEQGREWS